MRMRALAASSLLLLAVARAMAGEFTHEAFYDSPQDFADRAKAFMPGKTSGYMAFLFSCPEPGDFEDPACGKIKIPETVAAVRVLLDEGIDAKRGKDHALVLATAEPETALRSVVGVVFLLSKTPKGNWRITDLRVFRAQGKYAAISAELTSGGAAGEGEPIFIVSRTEGGRGYDFRATSTFRINGQRIEEYR